MRVTGMGFRGAGRIAVLAAWGLIALATGAQGGEGEARAVLAEWLHGQAAVEGWQAEVTQRRTIPALVEPLEARGNVWFQRPNRFRWELGDPPRTIAVREADTLIVHHPRLDRTERYPLDGDPEAPEQQALALLELGFPEDVEAFLARYELVGAERDGERWVFRLRPAATGARQLVSALRLVVDPEEPVPLATAVEFADGTVMRNEFSERRLGAVDDEGLFRID